MKQLLRLAFCGVALLLSAWNSDAADVTAPQLISGNVTWTRNNTYILNGGVFVRNGATLNIEAGTVIKGRNIGDALGLNVGALYVCRGGKIMAEGTAQNPIIFTAESDDVSVPDDIDLVRRGLWGGVVILGRTTINGALDSAGNAATPKYEVYEGLQDYVVTPEGTITTGAGDGERLMRFGGDDDNDNSGVLRYVSIRHGGALLVTGKEINGLSLGAVGRGTTIDYVEAYAIADDGFEFFGGTVNAKHLVSAFCDDDSFDVDMGYRGKGQFWFGIQAPDRRNFGMEINNQVNEIQTQTKLTPASDFQVYNLTIIGSGTANTVTTGGRNAAITLRPFAGPKIYNSIYTDFNETALDFSTSQGVSGSNAILEGSAQFHNNIWWGFVQGSGTTTVDNSVENLSRDPIGRVVFTDATLKNQVVNPLLTSVTRTNLETKLDPRPQTGSPAFSDVAAAPNDGFFTSVNYRGAFGKDLWISGWTALSEYGVLQPAGANEVIAPQLISGDVTWTRNNTYILNGGVFVRSGATLNIEAGTVIKGRNIGDALGLNVGALYVCRGGKIMAEGTAQNPIIFTAESDDLSVPDDIDLVRRGLWGGVVILGRTTINGALDSAGNAATPKYEVYEGLQDYVVTPEGTITTGAGDGERLMRFGGDDDNDNSGVFRYVSIRHGGALLTTGKEINGLSLGAVGRGTTVEFVEAYAIADDGFEFFGGTVNTKYLVSAFCDDDSFDVDMGYRGKGQFWFGIQAPDRRNFGMEINNQVNEIQTQTKLAPASDFQVYNLTIIGSGTANTVTTGGRNAAITLRPFAGPKIYNSIYTDFNETALDFSTSQGVSGSTAITEGSAQFHNNIWWGFVQGSGTTTVDNSVENLARDPLARVVFTDTTLKNQIVDPMLTGISRTNLVGSVLDPRPLPGSPAFSDAATVPNDGFYTPVTYRGAFSGGSGNWLADWTALSEYQVVTGAGAVHPSGIPTIVIPDEPMLGFSHARGSLIVTIPTQVGFNYQAQSTMSLNGVVTWANEGAAIVGTGNPETVSFSTTDTKFFRIAVQ